MNIFAALRQDHDKQRTLVQLLVKTHGDSDGRQQLLERLEREMKSHAAAEERNFYARLLEHDLTQDKARHSIAEHHELDELLEKLRTTDMSSSGWLSTAQKLEERLTHHLDEEEHEIFQLAGKALTEAQKTALASAYTETFNEQKQSHA